MKLKYRLLSLITSAALALGLCPNAFAAAAAKAAAPVPAITLAASAQSVQVGDSLTITLSVDGSEKGFSTLLSSLNYNTAAFTPVSASGVSNANAQGYTATAPTLKKDGTFSKLLLSNTSDLKVMLENAATYTFTAAKAGTYDFSVTGQVSAVDCEKSNIEEAANIKVTVSAKTLDAAVSDKALLKATYGDSADKLTAQIDEKIVTFTSGSQTVTPKGTWSYSGDALTVNDHKATFRFTPSDSGLYAPLDVEIPVSISPKALTASLKPASASKAYDGTTVLKGEYTIALSGGVSSDKLSATTESLDAPAYQSSDVSKDIAITAPFKVNGENLGCYTIGGEAVTADKEFTASATGEITPYTGEVTVTEKFNTRSYNGSEQPLTESELTLTDKNGLTLVLEKDFDVAYPNGSTGSAGSDTTVSYTFTGKGNYAGCTFRGSQGSFVILKLPMPTYSGSLQDAAYTLGSDYSAPGTESIQVAAKGEVSLRYQVNGSWSETVPAEPGRYTIGAYFTSQDPAFSSGMLNSITATLTVNKNLTKEDFSLDQAAFTYNGQKQAPKVTSKLTENADYTVNVPASTDAGSYEVTITGTGFYLGTVNLSYTIEKATGSASVTMQNYAYGSTPSQPQVSSDTNGTDSVTYTYTGRDGTEYQSAQAPAAVGKYTVTATFAATQNSSECTASADFEVTAKGLVADDFALDNTQFTYDGQNHTPNVTSKTALTPDTDYTVSFPESVNAGAYKVTVTGKGNYTGSVTLDYTIAQAVYTLPGDASVSTELSEYPLSIYGGQALSLVNLKASGLPEGARFGWKDGSVKLNTTAGTADYEVTVDPNDANYTAATITVSVKTADKITAGSDTSAQLSTYLTAVRKIVSDQTSLNSGVTADLTNLTLSSALTPKQQDDLKSAHLSSLDLLKALDDSVSVTVHTKLDANSKNTLTGLNIPTGGQAAAGIASGDVTYTAKDITPDQPEKGQLIEVELTLTDSSNAQKQLAAPILVELKFKAKDADPKGKFQVIHKHTESDPAKNFSTISDCSSVSKSGEEITVQFLAASLSSFSIQYTAPASSGGSSSGSSATPKPDEPQPTPTPALTQSETTWLGGYSAMLGAKSGSTLSLDVSACEYLPGYIIGGVQKTGVTLNLTTPAGKLVLTPAAAKAMNAAYNYTFADAMAIAGKTAASAAATPAPVKDPTATAATPTPQPTQAPTAAPTAQPEATPQPTEQPEQEAPAAKSHSALPIVAAIVVVALLAAGGYLAYNSASRKKAVREVYAPTKKAHSNGSGKKPNSKR